MRPARAASCPLPRLLLAFAVVAIGLTGLLIGDVGFAQTPAIGEARAGANPSPAAADGVKPGADDVQEDDDFADASKAELTKAVKRPEDVKALTTILVKDIHEKTERIGELDKKVEKLAAAPHDDPNAAALLANIRLEAETQRQALRRDLSVAKWIVKERPFRAVEEGPRGAPPSSVHTPRCEDIEACRQLKEQAAGRNFDRRCEGLGTCGPIGVEPKPIGTRATKNSPGPRTAPDDPSAETSASQQSTWQRWLDQQPPEVRERLAQQYREHAERNRQKAAELNAAIEAAGRAQQAGEVANDQWVKERVQTLEARKNEGLRQFRIAALPGAVEAKARELAALGGSPAGFIGEALRRVVDTQRAAETLRGAADGMRKQLEAVGALAAPSTQSAAGLGGGAAAQKTAAAAAWLMFGPRASAPSATLALAVSDMVRGGGEALLAERELRQLKLLIQGQPDAGARRAMLRHARDELRSRLNVLSSVASEFFDIADAIAKGRAPAFLPLMPEVQEALYSSARRLAIAGTERIPIYLRSSEPGGIKFSPSGLDPSVFRLDIDALYFDRVEKNLVLSGIVDERTSLIDADIVAAGLLLAAQGGSPWFSLDPINAKDWDDVVRWVPAHLRERGTRWVAERFRELRRQGKVIQRARKDGRVELVATLDAVDRALYDQLRSEAEIGVRIAFSHEFLRYSEAGRILFDADKALKQALEGAVVVGDGVYDVALGRPLSDKISTSAGRGDFAPQVADIGRAEGLVGVNDLTVKLELIARHDGTNVDDKAIKVEAFTEAMERFNGNMDGVRDRILESSYPIGRLRQFFKAYLSARALMERSPELRSLVLASVRPPLRDPLPDRYYESPTVVFRTCKEFLDGLPCPDGARAGIGASYGFGGGIIFGDAGRRISELRDAPVSAALVRVASVARVVARPDGPGVVTRDGRMYLRVALTPPPHARELGEIDLKRPDRPLPKVEDPAPAPAEPPGNKPQFYACALAGLLAAFALVAGPGLILGARESNALRFLTALPALALAAALALKGGLFGAEGGALLLFLVAATAALTAQLRSAHWGAPAAIAFHLSVLAAAGSVLFDALLGGASAFRVETLVVAGSAAALLLLTFAAASAPVRRWKTLCGNCRRGEAGSLAAVTLSGAAWLAGALLFAMAVVWGSRIGPYVADLSRAGQSAALGAALFLVSALAAIASSGLRAALARAAGARRISPPARESVPRDTAAAVLAASAWSALGGARPALAAILGAALFLASAAWRHMVLGRDGHAH